MKYCAVYFGWIFAISCQKLKTFTLLSPGSDRLLVASIAQCVTSFAHVEWRQPFDCRLEHRRRAWRFLAALFAFVDKSKMHHQFMYSNQSWENRKHSKNLNVMNVCPLTKTDSARFLHFLVTYNSSFYCTYSCFEWEFMNSCWYIYISRSIRHKCPMRKHNGQNCVCQNDIFSAIKHIDWSLAGARELPRFN